MNLDTQTLKATVTIAFFVVILLFSIASLLAASMLIRYGRTPGISILTSLMFGAVFILGTLTAYLSLRSIF